MKKYYGGVTLPGKKDSTDAKSFYRTLKEELERNPYVKPVDKPSFHPKLRSD